MSTPPLSDPPPPPMPQLGIAPTPLFRPLTKLERILLSAYRDYYNRAPTLAVLYQKSRMRIIIPLGGAVIVLVLTSLIGVPSMGRIFLAFAMGVVLNLHGLFRQFLVTWPLYRSIINWQAVDALLAGDLVAARAAADKVAPSEGR